VLLTEVRDSDVWLTNNPTEGKDELGFRIQNLTNLIDDVNSTTATQLADFILQYNDAAVQLYGLTSDDLDNSLVIIFAGSGHTILTDAAVLSTIVFDAADTGYFTLEQEEDIMVIVSNFVALINDLNQLFQLDLENWEVLLTKFSEHLLSFYVDLNNIFVFPMQSYLSAVLEIAALGVGTFSEIQDSITEYNSLVGWMNICAGTTIFNYGKQWLSYGEYLSPRWIDVINEYIAFWNKLTEIIPFFSNINGDITAEEISWEIEAQINEMSGNGKRTIEELRLLSLPFAAVIDDTVNQYLC